MTEPNGTEPGIETLRTAFHYAPMGIFICDSGGRYLSVNPRMAELFGYSTPEDFLREVEHVNDQVSNDGADAEGGDGCLGEVGEHQDCEIQVRLSSGKQVWRSRWMRAVPGPSGEPRRFVGAVVDIAERKRLEDVREKGISAARHDLKDPLLSILSGLELLDRHRDAAEREGILDSLKEKARSALELLDKSLQLFRMARGAYALDPMDFDLAPLFRELRERFVKQANRRDVSLLFRLDGTPLEEAESWIIHAEERLVESLLLNLLKNALEASPEHNAISLNARTERDCWILDVHNQGEVPENLRDCFFEPYTTEGKPHGTGLGTYSARLIAEAHGGGISLRTSAEEGTHVTVRLPRPGSKPKACA
jgi:PAS domain S-box-containing protein